MSIARDMPEFPRSIGAQCVDVSCIVGMFIYGIKNYSFIALAYREYNSLSQGNIASGTPSHRRQIRLIGYNT